MKKLYFSLFVALSLLMTACVAGLDNELNRAEISISHYADLIAEIEDGSRTYIEDGKYQYWHEGDLLSVFYGNTLNSQYRFNGKTGDNDGTFSVVENDELSTGNPLNSIYALYPYDATATISDNGTISCTLPSVQTYADNSFGVGANTMVAVTENCEESTLHFKNLCGYLKIKLYGNAVINLVELTGNSGEKLAGAATVTALHGKIPTVNMSSEATTSIALNCGDGVTLGKSAEEATEFWFVVPPTIFENGFSIVATNSEGAKFKMSTSKKIAIERNAIQPMEAVEATTFVTVPNNQIFYTSSDGAIVEPYATDVFGANIVSNTYENGKGVITFDGDVTQIGAYAFYVNEREPGTTGGRCLTSITIPNSVTEIGEYAFAYCPLADVAMPNGVTKIGPLAFGVCRSLTNIVIPNSVTHIEEKAFISCISLTEVTIPESVISIGDRAFVQCHNMTAFYGKYASEDNRCLIVDGVLNSFAPAEVTEYTIPQGVKAIGQLAFKCNTNNFSSPLKSVTIPDSVTSIGYDAFSGCTSLQSVYCKSITPPAGGSRMFNNNATDRKIYVPAAYAGAYKSADYWKDYADYIIGYNFENGEVAAPQPANNEIWYTSTDGDIVTPHATDIFGANIVSNTYENGKGMITFDNEITQIGTRAFQNCASLTSITIPDNVTSIGNYAFGDCELLTTITIPDSVVSIGTNPFVSCSSLSALYGKFASEDNRCLIVDGVLNSFAIGCGATEYSIPAGITAIGAYAFYYCESLTNITIPNSVTEIGYYAFYRCTSLTSINIPNGVTSIGNYAFCECSTLTNINIPNGVTSIGNYAFCKCSTLTNINIPNGVTSIGNYAFYQCKALSNVDIPNSVVSIGAVAFWACNSFTSATIPNSVTELGTHAFACCAKLEYFYGKFASSDNRCLIVDNTLNSYAAGATLTSYTIPGNITKIDNAAFQNSDYLTSVIIPESVTSIGGSAFYHCSNLVSVYCKPTTPPTGATKMFGSNASGRKIYVPSALVGIYKATQYWSDYADAIFSESGDDSTITDSVATPEDKYPSKTNFKRRMLLTQFTGTACGFCPRIINALYQLNSSSYADDVVLTAAHLYNSTDPAYLSSATSLSSSLGVSSFPNVCVDLNKSAITNSSYSSIISLIDSASSRVSVKGGIAVNSKYDAENGTIALKALVKAKESTEFRIGAWLLEDGIYGVQANNNYTPLDGVDFNTHNNCIRTAYSNQTNSDFTGFSLGIIEAGKSASHEFAFSLKNNGTGDQTHWNHDNLRLVVFISTKEGDNWLVNNVVKIDKNGSVDFEYLD